MAVAASEPTTHRPVTAIELYVDGQLAGRNNGAASVFQWGAGQLAAGVHRFTLLASLGDSTPTAQETFLFQVYPKASSARNPGEFIGFALPLARQERTASGVPVSFAIAQAAVESNWGTSGQSSRFSNYFNIRCDTDPASGCADLDGVRWRSYASGAESFGDHGRLLRQNPIYQQAFAYTGDAIAFARAIANVGFGSGSGPSYAQQDHLHYLLTTGLSVYDGAGPVSGAPAPAATPRPAATPMPPAVPTRAPTAVQPGQLVLITEFTVRGEIRGPGAADLLFGVRNVGGQPVRGVLFPEGAQGDVTCVSPWKQEVTLEPGQVATYGNTCQIPFPGSYILFPAFSGGAIVREITWPDGMPSRVGISVAPTATPRPPTATPVPPTPTPRPTSPPAPVSGTYPVAVPATVAWQNTGVAVTAGSRLTIDYVSGRWSPWPGETFDANGTLRSCPSVTTEASIIGGVCHFSLIGRIGNGAPVLRRQPPLHCGAVVRHALSGAQR